MSYGDKTSSFRYEPGQLLEVYCSVAAQRHKHQFRPSATGQLLPGYQIAVMLHGRQQELVTRMDVHAP